MAEPIVEQDIPLWVSQAWKALQEATKAAAEGRPAGRSTSGAMDGRRRCMRTARAGRSRNRRLLDSADSSRRGALR